MSFGKTVAIFGASFVGIVLGHSIIRSILGPNQRRHYSHPQNPPQNQSQQQNNQQRKQGIDNLRGKRLFDD